MSRRRRGDEGRGGSWDSEEVFLLRGKYLFCCNLADFLKKSVSKEKYSKGVFNKKIIMNGDFLD